MNEASDEVGLYSSENLASKNIGIDTEIASTSVSVAKLLLLPVVPDSVFHGVDASVSGSGVPENYVIAVEITMISFFVAKL